MHWQIKDFLVGVTCNHILTIFLKLKNIVCHEDGDVGHQDDNPSDENEDLDIGDGPVLQGGHRVDYSKEPSSKIKLKLTKSFQYMIQL